MPVVKKAAKTSLFIFGFLVLLIVAGGIYVYVNLNDMTKKLVEYAMTDALGVPVVVGTMDVDLEHKKIVVSDIKISNPPGYKKEHAITVGTVTIAAETLSQDLLSFARIDVDQTNVNLEVDAKGTNLGDLKKGLNQKQSAAEARAQSTGDAPSSSHTAPKVIVKHFSLTQAQVNPSVTLLDRDLAFIVAPDLVITGVGEQENGITPEAAATQITAQILQHLNKSANQAGFLEGLSLDALNDIGVTTLDVFKKNLKKNFDEDVDQFKKGLDGVKSLFEQ